MSKLIIKKGTVVDPLNEIEGETKDILIEDGKIVEKFSNESDIKEIDASGKTVIPAAVDTHTNVASQQVNWARLLGSANQQFRETWGDFSLSTISRDYIANGYTFILETNVFPSFAKQTHLNFQYLPVLDKAISLNVSNLWALESEYQKNHYKQAAVFLGDLVKRTKSYGLSSINPFEAEEWNLKNLREDIKQEGRLYNFLGIDVYETLIEANEQLGLPNSVQAHIEGYEASNAKNNLKILLDKVESLELDFSEQAERSHIVQIMDAPSLNTGENNEEFIQAINGSNRINIDLSVIGFDEINPLITSDRRLYNKYNETQEVIQSGMEMEGDLFVTLRKFDKQEALFSTLWANAIDLALNIEDKWKVQLSYSFPNYSHPNKAPEIATWLLSPKARKKFIDKLNPEGILDSVKKSDDRLSFTEYVIITRAGPAQSIGLGDMKGNLGIGADGDLNILDLNVTEIDFSSDYDKVKSAFENIECVVKSGEIVKQGKTIDLSTNGKIFWSERTAGESKSIMSKKRKFYAKFGANFYDQLSTKVPDELLRKI
ncbi:MAG: amidohydrolase family protein [Promethearchaeia archaeon]